ncbi:MAG: outer membrane beta-barrel protein [Ferruginibacter sp.]|nr:outer membrane beta-barrel protein [Ferruginibacter sp.]
MFNANDCNLEETSKNAAEQFSDASLIPDWQQLEKKLDIELPVKKKRRRFVAMWFVFTGMFISTFYVIYNSSYNDKLEKHIIAELTAKENSEQNKSTSYFNNKKENQEYLKGNANQANKIVARNVTDEFGVNKKNYTFPSQPNINSPLNVNNAAKRSKVVKDQLNELPVKSKKEKLLMKETEIENNANNYSLSTITQNLLDKKDNVNSTTEKPIDTESKKNIKPSENIHLNKDTVNNTISNTKKNNKGSKHNRSFTIAVVAGTNMNSVQLNKYSKPGFEYGLIAGYRISPKIEIRTGVIFSRKYFTAIGKSMSFDSAKLNLPYYSSINLEDATGYCRFVEIPVMLYYHFSSKNRTSFYTGAGFSINKMRMENIHYTFLVNSNTIVERTHAASNHEAYGYSASITSNFSFGLNQKISNRWSLAFEPYIKIPLTRVNNNDLKLTTLGVSASVIHNLANKKNK